MENAYEPWFTKPNHTMAPEISLGGGKSAMGCRSLADGMTELDDTCSPAKVTVSLQNWSLEGLRTIPCLAQRSR